jgi:hypothetical protein
MDGILVVWVMIWSISANKRQSIGRHSSVADQSHGVFFLYNTLHLRVKYEKCMPFHFQTFMFTVCPLFGNWLCEWNTSSCSNLYNFSHMWQVEDECAKIPTVLMQKKVALLDLRIVDQSHYTFPSSQLSFLRWMLMIFQIFLIFQVAISLEASTPSELCAL